MKKNVGTLDAHIRLTIGFSLLGMGIINSSKTMVGLGAMKIATGISRFCPIMHLLKITTLEDDNSLNKFVKKIPEYADQMAQELGME